MPRMTHIYANNVTTRIRFNFNITENKTLISQPPHIFTILQCINQNSLTNYMRSTHVWEQPSLSIQNRNALKVTEAITTKYLQYREYYNDQI